MSKKHLEFHIAHDDYFGTLATVLDLLRQVAERHGYTTEMSELLEQVKGELLYLQAHYDIERKTEVS